MVRNNRRRRYKIPQSLSSEETLKEWERLAKRETTVISEDIYKGTIKNKDGKKVHLVREKLIKIYHGKCAYCESKEYTPDVEHYRPKKRVTKVKGHKGYYWLAYEWTNLFPACTFCNSRSGKWDKFPISLHGIRQFNAPISKGMLNKAQCKANSNDLKAEKPLILNPEVDFPAIPFQMDQQGKFTGLEERGKETIQVCDLNRRNLLFGRKSILDDFFERISDALLLFNDGTLNEDQLYRLLHLIYKRLQQRTDPRQALSFAAKFIFDNFHTLIGEKFSDPDQRKAVLNSFNKFSKENS